MDKSAAYAVSDGLIGVFLLIEVRIVLRLIIVEPLTIHYSQKSWIASLSLAMTIPSISRMKR